MQKGFTLIELLIVVANIAILAAIAVPNFIEAQVRAKVSRAHPDIRSISTTSDRMVNPDTGTPPRSVRIPSGNQRGVEFPVN